MLSALDVARYFLAKSDPESGELVSNLKLQKLCYYAQGCHLALFGTPLFREPIKAWAHGPVVPTLWHEYKSNGSGAIHPPTDINFELYDQGAQEFLDEVLSVYGQFSAWKLRNMTHEEPPWKEAYGSEDDTINTSSMREYFKNLVNADGQE